MGAHRLLDLLRRLSPPRRTARRSTWTPAPIHRWAEPVHRQLAAAGTSSRGVRVARTVRVASGSARAVCRQLFQRRAECDVSGERGGFGHSVAHRHVERHDGPAGVRGHVRERSAHDRGRSGEGEGLRVSAHASARATSCSCEANNHASSHRRASCPMLASKLRSLARSVRSPRT